MSLFDSASLIVTPNGYKEDKLYSIKPSDGSGDLVVTRATTATRVNSDGLIEVTPRNLLQYSEQFDNLIWIKQNCSTTSNSTIAPNGTLSADTITDISTFGIIYQSIAFSNASQVVTYSIYFKKSNNDWVNVSIARGGATTYGEFGAWFNLSTGAIGSNYLQGAGVLINKEIESVGNGWFRCSITGYVPNATAYLPLVFNSNADNSSVSSIGQSHYQWGAQLVTGTSAKEYFPTTDRLDVPRLDYTNSSCPSILVEGQRTNLITYSEQFDNSAWTLLSSNATVTANNVISPDGTQNADKVVFGLNGYLYQIKSITSAVSATFSIYSKTATQKIIFGGASISGTDVYSSINVGNGWFRQILTRTFTSGGTGNVQILPIGSNETLYFWGAQFEVGSYATSYIPTIASSVTRNADVISKTGISSLIGQTEGTMFVDFVMKNNISSVNRIISLTESNWISGGSIRIDIQSNNISVDFINNGASIGSIIYSNVFTQNTRYKIAIAYKTNDCALYMNGTQLGTNTSIGTMPTCSEIYLNELGGGFGGPYQATAFNQATLFKTRLSNTELAQLTSL